MGKMTTVRVRYEEELWPVHILVPGGQEGGTPITVPDEVADRWTRITAEFAAMQEQLEVYRPAPEEP